MSTLKTTDPDNTFFTHSIQTNTNMSFALAFRFLKKDCQSSELKLLAGALILAIAAISSICFLSERARAAFSLEAVNLLGADMIVSSVEMFDDSSFIQYADKLGLSVSRGILLSSMAGIKDDLRLVSVRGIDSAFPLRGQLTGQRLTTPPNRLTTITPGCIWIDRETASENHIVENDMIDVGHTSFRVEAIIDHEPSRLSLSHQLSAKILMRMDDLQNTGLIDRNSRLLYLLSFSGSSESISKFTHWIEPKLTLTQRIRTAENIQPEARRVIDRLNHFFIVVGLVASILACITIALCAQRFVSRHADVSAMLRCLGMSSTSVKYLYGGLFVSIGLISSIIGCMAGWLTQYAGAIVLENWLGVKLPPIPWFLPIGLVFIGTAWLLALSIPTIHQLIRIPIIRVLRPSADTAVPIIWKGYIFAIAIWSVLTFYQLQDWQLTAILTIGLLGIFIAFSLFAALLLHIVIRPLQFATLPWRLVYRSARRQKTMTVIQIVSLSLGLTFLALLMLIRSDLIHSWQQALNAQTPNYFLTDIFPEQMEDIKKIFDEHQLQMPVAYPMLRTHLVEKNGQPVKIPTQEQDIEAHQLLRRGFFITWTNVLPPENTIIDGVWIPDSPSSDRHFSLEADFARTLGLTVGDTITFKTGETRFSGIVSSIRSLQWTSMNVNFFGIATPGGLESLPHTMIFSFHLPQHQKSLIHTIVDTYPNIVIYPLSDLIHQLQGIIDKAALAVQLIFWWTLLIGLLVVLATRFTAQGTLTKQISTMRILGASERLIRQFCFRQGIITGSLSAIIAIAAVTLLGHVIGKQLFNRPIYPGWLTLVIIPTVSIILMSIAGHSLANSGLKRPLAALLRAPD